MTSRNRLPSPSQSVGARRDFFVVLTDIVIVDLFAYIISWICGYILGGEFLLNLRSDVTFLDLPEQL